MHQFQVFDLGEGNRTSLRLQQARAGRIWSCLQGCQWRRLFSSSEILHRSIGYSCYFVGHLSCSCPSEESPSPLTGSSGGRKGDRSEETVHRQTALRLQFLQRGQHHQQPGAREPGQTAGLQLLRPREPPRLRIPPQPEPRPASLPYRPAPFSFLLFTLFPGRRPLQLCSSPPQTRSRGKSSTGSRDSGLSWGWPAA